MACVAIELLSTLGAICRGPTDNGLPARDHPPRERGKGIRMTRKFIHLAVATGAAVAVTAMMTAAAAGSASQASTGPRTATPIKHVVVIIGENHSFDNIFATYQPPRHQKIWNLLSEGIVTKSGAPGPNLGKAAQLTASNTKTYSLNPKITGAYKALPKPNTTYVLPLATDRT